MLLHKEGYKVKTVTTFGQPMVTNGAGCEMWGPCLPLLRVRHEQDPVPLLPPVEPYQHFGTLLQLRAEDSSGFTLIPAEYVDASSKGHSWTSMAQAMLHVADHHMQGYLSVAWGIVDPTQAEHVSPALRKAVVRLCSEAAADGKPEAAVHDDIKRMMVEAPAGPEEEPWELVDARDSDTATA